MTEKDPGNTGYGSSSCCSSAMEEMMRNFYSNGGRTTECCPQFSGMRRSGNASSNNFMTKCAEMREKFWHQAGMPEKP